MNSVAHLDAVGQAELVRRREVSPQELVEAAIGRIEQLNPRLDAVISPTFDKARQQAASAQLADGPFRGVPFLVKVEPKRGTTPEGTDSWRDTASGRFVASARSSTEGGLK